MQIYFWIHVSFCKTCKHCVMVWCVIYPVKVKYRLDTWSYIFLHENVFFFSEPFNHTNTARSLYKLDEFSRAMIVFRVSCNMLKRTKDLDSIFSERFVDWACVNKAKVFVGAFSQCFKRTDSFNEMREQNRTVESGFLL